MLHYRAFKRFKRASRCPFYVQIVHSCVTLLSQQIIRTFTIYLINVNFQLRYIRLTYEATSSNGLRQVGLTPIERFCCCCCSCLLSC